MSIKHINNFGGFTLIQLLVVVLIIGILAAVAVPQYQKAVEKARLMESVVQGKALMTAQREYMLANGAFATDLSTLAIELPSDTWDCIAHWCKGPEMQGTRIQITGNPTAGTIKMDCITDGPKENNLCKTLGATFDYTHENGYDYYILIPFM